MTRIVYKPHCAKCGALINGEVAFREIIDELKAPNGYFCNHPIYDISPYKCEKCGELFEGIEMKMPEYEREVL